MLNVSKNAINFINFKRFSNMASGLKLKDVVKQLETFAPLSYAENWDNVGLLLEPCDLGFVKNILLTNDLTECVMQEALNRNANLIISYHPPIFTPLKRITQMSWKERIISMCLSKSIALYSPHTAWDAVSNGVNDWLASALPNRNIKPIKPIPNCIDGNVGSGRIFNTSISLGNAIVALQKHIGLDVHVAVAMDHTLDTNVTEVAICAGSGASLLSGVKADLYITGEMSHHEVLNATHNGTSVILCNHSNSERGFLKTFLPKLTHLLNNACEVMVSETDEDPIKTFMKSN